jgi:hypothetical protein
MSPAHSTEKWTNDDTIGTFTVSEETRPHQGRIFEIGRPYPVNELVVTRRPLPSLPAMVEQVTRQTEPHSCIPIGDLPPLVLVPNRRKVDPEEELEESTVSSLVATSQRLAKTIRSLSLKRGR